MWDDAFLVVVFRYIISMIIIIIIIIIVVVVILIVVLCGVVWFSVLSTTVVFAGAGVFPPAPSRLHACISPSRTTGIMVCTSSPSALRLKKVVAVETRLQLHPHILKSVIQTTRDWKVKVKKKTPWNKNIQQPNDALVCDKIVWAETRANCLNCVIPSPRSHRSLLFSVFPAPQRQAELITSECTPQNDGWAPAMGLSGEGAGPYGSGIWKLIVEDGAKGGEWQRYTLKRLFCS